MCDSVVPMLDIRVLGPLSVRVDERVASIPGVKLKEFFVRLVLARGEPVTTDQLTDALWDDRPPTRPVNTIERYASMLRKELGHGSVAKHGPAGYALSLDDAYVDAVDFETLVTAARNDTDAGEHRAAAEKLGRAMPLWRATPYADVQYREFVQPAIRHLWEIQESARESWAEVLLATGRNGDAIAECRAGLDRSPINERLWAQLMTAYCRAGRKTEALRAYAKASDALAESGLAPSPELAGLEERILSDDPSLAGWTMAPPTNLAEARTMYGRVHEVSLLVRDLELEQVVWIVGEPGVGKSVVADAVARRAGDRFRDGVWWIPCAGYDRADLVLDSALGVLGVMGTAEPADQLGSFLRSRNALVVFDGCEESVLRGLEKFGGTLGPDSASRVIVTSRAEPDDAFARRVQRWEVSDAPAGATTSPAVEAFLSAAGVDPREASEGDLERAVHIVAATGGLPSEVVSLGRAHLPVDDEASDVLDDEVLVRMAVFGGAVDIGTLRTVIGYGALEGSELDFRLHRLVAAERVAATRTTDGALYRVTSAGPAADVEAELSMSRHESHYAELAFEWLDPSNAGAVLWRQIRSGRHELKLAAERALAKRAESTAAALAYAVGSFRVAGGTYLHRLIDWLRAIDERLIETTGYRSGLVRTLGLAHFRLGDFKTANDEYLRALAMADDIDDEVHRSAALLELGHLEMFLGHYGRSADYLAGGHRLSLTLEAPSLQARAMQLIAQRGLYESLRPTLEQAGLLESAAVVYSTLDMPVGEANARLLLATWHLLRGDLAEARDEGRRALDLLSPEADQSMLSFALSRNAHVSTALNHPEEAMRMAREAVVMADSIGNRLVLAAALVALGDAWAVRNSLTSARALGAAANVYAMIAAEQTAVDRHFRDTGWKKVRAAGGTDDAYKEGLVGGPACLSDVVSLRD